MPDRPHHGVIQYLRRIVGREEAIDVSDGQLLGRFVTQHDEAAFELLVRRHGKMVLDVCRRLIHDEQAAEDAFQAAFLVLARRAASIDKRSSLGGWLYKLDKSGSLLGLPLNTRLPIFGIATGSWAVESMWDG